MANGRAFGATPRSGQVCTEFRPCLADGAHTCFEKVFQAGANLSIPVGYLPLSLPEKALEQIRMLFEK
jgi:hypothetical protein